jgi:hypothetical protein
VSISFGITLLLLSLAAVLGFALFPSGNGVIVKHITGEVPSYTGVLGEFAPSNALQVSYNNFTAVREINSTALPLGNYLNFTRPSVSVTTQSIEQRVSVVLSVPNATVDITLMDSVPLDNLQASFSASLTPAAHAGSHDLYMATALVNRTVVQTWVAFVHSPDALIFCSSSGTAEAAMSQVLSVFDGSTPSLLSNTVTGRLLDVANGTDGHLGVSIQNYAGVVTTGQMTLITIDNLNTSLSVNHFVAFSNQSEAQSQIDYFKRVYIGSEKFESYDDVLVAIQSQPLKSLVEAIGLVG